MLLEILISDLISAFIGVIIGVLFEKALTHLKESTTYTIRRFVFKYFRKGLQPTRGVETFSFGPLATSWIVIDGDGELEYAPQAIRAHFDPHPVELPADLLERKLRIEKEEGEKRQSGRVFRWNGPLYSLDRFVISRSDLEEYLALEVWFRLSDYFTFLATNMSLDEPAVREKYLQGADWHSPHPFFSNAFGINLAVITADEYIIIAQRSQMSGCYQGAYGISANEALSEFLDRSDQGHAPDLYRCAIRAAKEELGIEGLTTDKITFLSLGVDTRYSQWALLGMTRTEKKAAEILHWRSTGVKDKWENADLYMVKFEPDAVVQFVLTHGPWTPHGLACLYHTLVHEFHRSKIERAIRKRVKKLLHDPKPSATSARDQM